jgi:hypothetical protein
MGEEERQMTKKEAMKPPPLLYMFEQILDGRGLFMDSDDWRELRYSCHVRWLEPLIAAGSVTWVSSAPAWPEGADSGGRPQCNYHKYAVTPAGAAWWFGERVREAEDRGVVDLATLAQNPRDATLNIEWIGIGGVITEWWEPRVAVLFKGLKEGLFDFVRHDNGNPSFWRMGETLTARLTRKGYEYYAALPRLVLDCA